MAEDETILDTDVVDFEGNLKGAFPSELRYAPTARLPYCIPVSSTRYRAVRILRGQGLCEEQEDHGGSEHYSVIDFESKSR